MNDRTGGFVGAAQFLTRVPIPTRAAPDLAAAVVWFPVVGGLIGAAVGAVAAGLGEVVPVPVAAAVAVLFGIAITGAFHEDGLADTADALAGGWTREQRLEILADPRHGSYGVAALCGSIVVRVVAVASLAPAAAFAGLVAAHALGRGSAVVTMGIAPLAKADGLGAGYARSRHHSSGRGRRPDRHRHRRARHRLVGRPPRRRRGRGRGTRRVLRLAGDRWDHRRRPRRDRAARRVRRARGRHWARGPPPPLVDLTHGTGGFPARLGGTKPSSARKTSDGQETRAAKRRIPSSRSSSARAKEKRA